MKNQTFFAKNSNFTPKTPQNHRLQCVKSHFLAYFEQIVDICHVCRKRFKNRLILPIFTLLDDKWSLVGNHFVYFWCAIPHHTFDLALRIKNINSQINIFFVKIVITAVITRYRKSCGYRY